MANSVKILDVWSDLEVSFSKSNMSSRSAFLKKAVGYSDERKTHSLNHLLKIVTQSITETTDNDIIFGLTSLSELLKKLSNYIDKNGIPDEIPNLNVFVIESTFAPKELLTMENLVENSFISTIPTDLLSYKEMFLKYGCFQSRVSVSDIKKTSSTVKMNAESGVYNPGDKIDVVEVSYLEEYLLSISSSDDEFHKEVIKALSVLHPVLNSMDTIPRMIIVSSTDNLACDEDNNLILFDKLLGPSIPYQVGDNIILTADLGDSLFCSLVNS